jgi:hypothetical protein
MSERAYTRLGALDALHICSSNFPSLLIQYQTISLHIMSRDLTRPWMSSSPQVSDPKLHSDRGDQPSAADYAVSKKANNFLYMVAGGGG